MSIARKNNPRTINLVVLLVAAVSAIDCRYLSFVDAFVAARCVTKLNSECRISLYSTTNEYTTTAGTLNENQNDGIMCTNKDETLYSQYTKEELKEALYSLLNGSNDPGHDGRHLYGFDDFENHDLSKLQSITATRILDYKRYLNNDDDSSSSPPLPSEKSLEDEMKRFWKNHGPLLNLQDVIQQQAPRMALAAEFKRASPSKGNIAVHLNAGEQAQLYALAGANVVSVLTEPRWFLGSLDDLTSARLQSTCNGTSISGAATYRPAILRKEFTTSKYQINEALAKGADTILLIVAVLPQHLLRELIDHARSYGMEPLVEVHADVELEVALDAGAKVIGVNNRNLHTFQMDLGTTEHVAEELIKGGCVFDHSSKEGASNSKYTLCSLSGMSTAFDVNRYRSNNVGMCLIGESLMRAADPAAAIAGLCLDPNDWEINQENPSITAGGGAYTRGTKLVKICGVTNPNDALLACQSGANLIGTIFVPKSKRCVTTENAKSIVDVVRSFGERTERTVLKVTNCGSPASQMLSNAILLEQASRRPLVVGVFQNQPSEYIREMIDTCGLDLVQLHGNEGMEVCAEVGVPAIRVVDIETDPATGEASETAADTILASITTAPLAILLDTAIQGENTGGGTGVKFDHKVAEQVQNNGVPVIIAGGLSPNNVEDVLFATRPWGVDVSSGVETFPGTKDPSKLKLFIEITRNAAVEASKGF